MAASEVKATSKNEAALKDGTASQDKATSHLDTTSWDLPASQIQIASYFKAALHNNTGEAMSDKSAL